MDVTTLGPPKAKTDDFDRQLAHSMKALPVDYQRSDTVVLEAAFFLLKQGLLNIPDIGCVNVKQAIAFLWHAAWLQDHMSCKWREEPHSMLCEDRRPHFDEFALAVMGPGGTGKTAILKLSEALTIFFAGPDTVRKLAPSNAAARLLNGDTLHSLLKLPFGGASLSSKRGRLTKGILTLHRKKWQRAIAAYVDELSMISADQFLHCDVRMRQAKMQPSSRFGNLAVTVCGDFLQLPPVDKDGSRKSLAMPLDDVGQCLDDALDESSTQNKDAKQSRLAEGRQGFELWRSIRRVVCLSVNVRAPGVLSRLQQEMRSGVISDEMWDVYMSRVLEPNDPRLLDPDTPFGSGNVHFIVHRHKIRVMRSLEHAKTQSRHHQVPLYIVQACDEAVRSEDQLKLTDSVRRELLQLSNPDATKGLQSFLPLHRGMRLLLSSKDCVRFGIVKGCPCILEEIILAPEEILPYEHVAGHPHELQFMPTSLLLRAEKAEWTLPDTELPSGIPKNINRRGLFQLRPAYDYIRHRVGEEYITVRRTTFHASPADTITVYAAQGGTFDAVVADMKRPPNLDGAKHWLACYVMLSRATSLDGFLVLRPATRMELSARPPKYLLDELERLEKAGSYIFVRALEVH